MSSVAPRDSWSSFPSRVEANTRTLFELFAKYDARATLFFLGWTAERYPRLVREAQELGHEIACHSYWHRPVFRLSPAGFREDTWRAKQVIEDAAGGEVAGYRAPCFSINSSVAWAYDILQELGFQYDSSLNPVRHAFYGNHKGNRAPYRIAAGLHELPIATWRVLGQNLPVGGGAYLRILPYWLVSSGVSEHQRERIPAGDTLCPSLGDRRGTAAAASIHRFPRPPIHRPFANEAETGAPAATVQVRNGVRNCLSTAGEPRARRTGPRIPRSWAASHGCS